MASLPLRPYATSVGFGRIPVREEPRERGLMLATWIGMVVDILLSRCE